MSVDARAHGAIDLLARALAGAPDPFDIGTAASIDRHGEHGVSAEIELANGSRYRIVVEWIGDRESPE